MSARLITILGVLSLALLMLTVPTVQAYTSSLDGHHRLRERTPQSRSVGGHGRSYNRCANCERDGRGRIKRDVTARRVFEQTNPCPSNGHTYGSCPGYIVDHIVPLKRGGADLPENMQWQATAVAKAKDRVE